MEKIFGPTAGHLDAVFFSVLYDRPISLPAEGTVFSSTSTVAHAPRERS